MDYFLTVSSINIDVNNFKWSVNSEMCRNIISFNTITSQSTPSGSDKTDTLENISRITLSHLNHEFTINNLKTLKYDCKY